MQQNSRLNNITYYIFHNKRPCNKFEELEVNGTNIHRLLEIYKTVSHETFPLIF